MPRRNEQLMIGGVSPLLGVVLVGMMFLPSGVWSRDLDGDGLSDELESLYGSQFFVKDSDGDGWSDFDEVQNGFSPILPGGQSLPAVDTDKDKLLDWQEFWFQTDIRGADTDGDGMSDYDEVMSGLSPRLVSTSTVFERKVVVDLSKQQLHYTVNGLRLHTLPVSTGNPTMPTPPGEFEILRKIPVMRYVGRDYDFKGVKWNMEFKPRYYLHTAYWHNDFGKRTHSHGCINLREADAALLYKYTTAGLAISIIGETPRRFKVGT